MASRFAFSVGDKPSFNSCGAYIYNLISKGEINETTIRPSAPLAEKLIHVITTRRKYLQEIFSHDFHGSPERESKNDKNEVAPTDPVDIKDLSKQLLLACTCGKLDALKIMLHHSTEIDLNATLPCHNDQGFTPLALASISNNPSVSKLLIKTGADVDQLDSQGCSALHWAVLASHASTIKVLLGHGAKPDIRDSEGLTPLHYVCSSGHHQVAAILIKQLSAMGTSQPLATEVTPLIMACVSGQHEVMKTLVKRAPGLIFRGEDCKMAASHYAAWAGSVKCVKVLAGHSTWREGVAQRDLWGRTPLIIASAKGDPVVCQLLLKKGARLQEVDDEHRGVLHWAVLSGKVSCVEFLLQCKGGLELCSHQDSMGASPLHYAAIVRDTAILAAILKQDPGSGFAVATELSACVWAAGCGHLSSVQLLLGAQGPGGATRPDGASSMQPIHAAASVGAVEVCLSLLEAGAKVDVVCSEGLTPLHYASRFGHTECVRELLSRGAPVDSLSQKQESSLHLAVMHGHDLTAKELLDKGADRDKPSIEKESWPIHLASSYGHPQVLQTILSAGADVDQSRGSDSHTPLYLAASQGHLDCCRTLIEHGANTGTRMKSTIEGLTALDVSLINGHAGCASYLMSCHAPSGGGVYHRAAATIQALWTYHRYKRRRAVTHYWSAVVLQRCVRQWLCRRKAKRVREARQAAHHRAARSIQLKWRQFIAEKRRYEASCSRLKAKLRKEQLATSIIIAELQSQTQRVSLPSAAPGISKERYYKPPLLEKPESQPLRSVFPCDPVKVATPRRPLGKYSPSIRVTSTPKRFFRKPIASTSTLPHVEESSVEICSVVLPPIHDLSTTTTTTTSTNTTSLPHKHKPRAKDEDSGSAASAVKLPPIAKATAAHVNVTCRAREITRSTGEITRSTNVTGETTRSTNVTDLEANDETDFRKPTSAHQQDQVTGYGGWSGDIVKSPLRIPLQSQLKLTRRSSTFKATPLGYRPFLPRKDRKVEQSSPLFVDDVSNLRLQSAEDETAKVKFTNPEAIENTNPADSRSSSILPENTNLEDSNILPENTNLEDSSILPENTNLEDSSILPENTNPEDSSIPSSIPENTNPADSSIPENTNPADSSIPENTSPADSYQTQSGLEDFTAAAAADQKKVINQVERFERLVKVLSLLKGSTGAAEFGSDGVEVVGMEDLKEHIRLALDEAVQLRVETTAMQNKIGTNISVQSSPVSSL